jgi:ADP-heptose:LPS heptosyltransferase
MRGSGRAGKRSPLRGRYLVQNRAWNAALRGCDALLSIAIRRETGNRRVPRRPRRVLVAAGGHLGDAVIATGAVAALRRALPDAEIGVLTGSWARVVFEGHRAVSRIHTLDHWKLNRSGESFASRWSAYRRTLSTTVAELRDVRYDAAIDLYPFYPNMAEALWRAAIPRRVGWASGGSGPLYSHAMPWRDDDLHMLEKHAKLIDALGPWRHTDDPIAYDLPQASRAVTCAIEARMRRWEIADESFVVVHMGAGAREKEWPLGRWAMLVRRLAAAKQRVVFTGTGARQAEDAKRVAASAPRSVNLVGALDWLEFVHVLRRASLVLTVDTVAAHAAAAVGTPCVAVHTGINNPAQWRPLGSRTAVVSRAVPCAPCHRKAGCTSMACIGDVTVEDVLSARSRVVA